ncbi:MAG: hypothetical protein AAB647_00315, partial [Patescibacteria group bacterium]
TKRRTKIGTVNVMGVDPLNPKVSDQDGITGADVDHVDPVIIGSALVLTGVGLGADSTALLTQGGLKIPLIGTAVAGRNNYAVVQLPVRQPPAEGSDELGSLLPEGKYELTLSSGGVTSQPVSFNLTYTGYRMTGSYLPIELSVPDDRTASAVTVVDVTLPTGTNLSYEATTNLITDDPATKEDESATTPWTKLIVPAAAIDTDDIMLELTGTPGIASASQLWIKATLDSTVPGGSPTFRGLRLETTPGRQIAGEPVSKSSNQETAPPATDVSDESTKPVESPPAEPKVNVSQPSQTKPRYRTSGTYTSPVITLNSDRTLTRLDLIDAQLPEETSLIVQLATDQDNYQNWAEVAASRPTTCLIGPCLPTLESSINLVDVPNLTTATTVKIRVKMATNDPTATPTLKGFRLLGVPKAIVGTNDILLNADGLELTFPDHSNRRYEVGEIVTISVTNTSAVPVTFGSDCDSGAELPSYYEGANVNESQLRYTRADFSDALGRPCRIEQLLAGQTRNYIWDQQTIGSDRHKQTTSRDQVAPGLYTILFPTAKGSLRAIITIVNPSSAN